MNKFIKIISTSIMFSFLLITMPVLAENDIKVTVDNQYVKFDVQPTIINNRTMVPLRAIFEALGATVEWDNSTSTIISQKENITIRLTIGETKMYVNDSSVELDSVACIINNRTLVPVRAISEAFDLTVNWNPDTSVVAITSKQSNIAEIEFDDKAFERCVRYNLFGKETMWNEKLTDEVLKEINVLTLFSNEGEETVKSLNDIQYLPNLKCLTIRSENEIMDFSPISNIKIWEELNLQGLHIEDDDFLDDITVERCMIFPNLPEPWFRFPDFDEEYTYEKALEMYHKTIDELQFISDNIIDDDMTDFEKYKELHNYLIKKMRYDWDKYENQYSDSWEEPCVPHDLSKIFFTRKGVCSDYAYGYSSLCACFGLKCYVITGYAGVGVWGDHAWNIVNINGNYYHVDTTWDDPDADEHTDIVGYGYFLLSDTDISKDHKWDKNQEMMCVTMETTEFIPVPECTESYQFNN